MLIRTLTGALFIIVLLGAIIIDVYAAALLFLIFSILGLQEFYDIGKKNKISPQRLFGSIVGIVSYLLFVGVFTSNLPFVALIGILPMFFLIFVFELFRNKKNPIANIAFTLLGNIYVSLPFSLILGLGYFFKYSFNTTYNADLLISILIMIWSHDTAAYLSGKFFGKHKLFERISPRKTWEGSIGGGIMTLVAAYVVNLVFLRMDIVDALMIGIIIIFFGAVGDLIESMFKRSANVKDSGTLLPGHGGILDRFDSLLLSVPFIYFYLTIIDQF